MHRGDTRHYIQHYDCVHPKGYNLNSGGGKSSSFSHETKELLSSIALQRSLKRGVLGHIRQFSLNNWRFEVAYFKKRHRAYGFKTREDALEYQLEFSLNPEQFIGSCKNVEEVLKMHVKPKPEPKPREDIGITFLKSEKKWKATIYKDKKVTYLGRYKTKEEAINARKMYLADPENFVRPNQRKRNQI